MQSLLKLKGTSYPLSSQCPKIFGILNLTPDSFSDGGRYLDAEHALDQALKLEEAGADFLDIGAESTRPQASSVSEDEEQRRLLPILKKIIPRLKIPISIDTRKALVAQRAIDEGASIINDVSGLSFDAGMVEVLQNSSVGFVLMHSRGTPVTMGQLNQYEQLIPTLQDFFKSKLEELKRLGIESERILLDPGLGFAKVGDQNLEILANLRQLNVGKRPLLIGLSRKSFLEPYFGPTQHPEERQLGTEIAHTLCVVQSVQFLRVHDVQSARRTIRFVQSFLEKA